MTEASDSYATRHASPLRLWHAVDVTLSAEAREAVEYALMEAGALGTESNDDGGATRVSAYFNETPKIENIRAALVDALQLYDLPSSLVREMQLRPRR